MLNQAPYRGARILVADRELRLRLVARGRGLGARDYGVRCVIAPSFGDIFFKNCFKNGCSPCAAGRRGARASAPAPRAARRHRDGGPRDPDGDRPRRQPDRFEIDPFRKECLLNGQDEIALTLRYEDAIAKYERATRRRWRGPCRRARAPDSRRKR